MSLFQITHGGFILNKNDLKKKKIILKSLQVKLIMTILVKSFIFKQKKHNKGNHKKKNSTLSIFKETTN